MKGKAGVKTRRTATAKSASKGKGEDYFAFTLTESREIHLCVYAPDKKTAKNFADNVYLEVGGIRTSHGCVELEDDYTTERILQYDGKFNEED